MDIAKYNCPSCDEEIFYDAKFHRYECQICNISYFLPIKITHKPMFIVGSKVLCYGDFEYCCRIYKLKVFA